MTAENKQRLKDGLSFLACTVAFGFCFNALTGILGYHLNRTPSMPYGIYRIGEKTAKHSKLVAWCPESDLGWRYRSISLYPCADHREALIKPVLGQPGDTIVLSHDGVRLNGKLLPNTQPLGIDIGGIPLAPYSYGEYRITKDRCWLISTNSPRSWDSRYFGPVPASELYPVHPVLTWGKK